MIWRTIKLGAIPRLGAVIPAETQLAVPSGTVRSGDVCLIVLGASRHTQRNDEVPFEIQWRAKTSDDADAGYVKLFHGSLSNVDSFEPWVEYRFSLAPVAGTEGSIVIRNARSWRFWRRQSAELILYDLAISEMEALDLERARSFRKLRIRNETANFDAYYQHAVFQRNDERSTDTNDVSGMPAKTPPTAAAVSIAAMDPEATQSPPAVPPPRVVSALEYSHSQLVEKVGLKPPLFGWELKTKVDKLRASQVPGTSKLRVLSLCSGAARIEYDLVRGISPESLSLTLLDVNPNLLGVARRTLAPWGDVETIVADINEIDLRGQRFDVVLCVSALHHVVELEHVIRGVADAIGDTGEFWSIGETVGRNGGRMIPEAHAVASEYFSQLAERYRYNRNTSAVDHRLPDLDCSVGCFEGIRAESIEPTLLRFFAPVQVSKHNCLVWKLFSSEYCDNFNMAVDADRRLVDTAVDLDAALHRRGPYGVELHGIYRRHS